MKKAGDIKPVVIPESKHAHSSKENGKERFIAQGAVSESSTALGSSFIVPFAQGIGANAFHIGILSAFTGLLSPLGGLWGSKLMERKSRKTIHLHYTIWEALIWIPIIAIPFLFWQGFALSSLPYLLIILFSAFIFFSGIKGPPTFSWIGDLVEERERGKYFARRNRVIGFYGLIIFLLGGIILRYFESKNLLLHSIIGLLILSIAFRLYSYKQSRHIYCPRLVLRKKYYFSFMSFLKRYDNFGKFAVFQALFNFSIMVASPFFAVYMLKDLHFNIFTFTVVSLSSTAFYLLFTPLAGKFSDRYGNLKLLYIAGIAFPITPILWIFNQHPVYLIFVPGLTAGIANAAFAISVTNFTYDSVKPEKRGICVAYAGLLNGIGIFAGSILGGLMIEYLSISFMNTTLFVFLIAAALRVTIAMIFLPQLYEERKVKRMKGFSVDVFHPFHTVKSDIVWFKKFVHEK